MTTLCASTHSAFCRLARLVDCESAAPRRLPAFVMASWIAALGPLLAPTEARAGGRAPIHFDMAPIAVARAAEAESTTASPLPGQRLLSVSLRLSSLVQSPQPPTIDQLMIHVYCVDPAVTIADYTPRTELSSEVAGTVDVHQTEESSKHLGFSIDAAQGHALRGNLGGDAGSKDTQTLKYQKLAPLQVALASGTTHRGRGAYFKFRATTQQVIEGDKRITLTLCVPDGWRGGQLDVHISADKLHRSLPGLEPESRTVGGARFVVTTFTDGDEAMLRAVQGLTGAERKLRELADQYAQAILRRSTPNLWQQVAVAFDLGEPPVAADWLHRVLLGQVDTDLHLQLRRLPVDVRVAILDYQEARQRFLQTGQQLTDLAVR